MFNQNVYYLNTFNFLIGFHPNHHVLPFCRFAVLHNIKSVYNVSNCSRCLLIGKWHAQSKMQKQYYEKIYLICCNCGASCIALSPFNQFPCIEAPNLKLVRLVEETLFFL
ncbi:hypothetical protein ACFX2H_014559 [Malus domestica]